MAFEIFVYETEDGYRPYEASLLAIRDSKAKTLITRRVQRAILGNLGDHHSLDSGLHEMRLDYGPGYRIYFGRHGSALLILLIAGSKTTQQADINMARIYLADFHRRNS